MRNVKTPQNQQLRLADYAAGLQIRLLGPMSITYDGQPILIPSRKGRALMGYVALRQGVAFARLSLAGLLWGQRSEDQARASLRQTLSELRNALRDSAQQSIVATKETVT